jgi:hypothetical protein
MDISRHVMQNLYEDMEVICGIKSWEGIEVANLKTTRSSYRPSKVSYEIPSIKAVAKTV